MKDKLTVFDFLSQILCMFASTILVMVILTHFVGDTANRISSLFQLGNKGLALDTIIEFFLLSIVVTIFRFLFFSEKLIHKLSKVIRSALMLLSILVTIIIFVECFQWFPFNNKMPWLLFTACFLISYAVSIGIMIVKNNYDNRIIEQKLLIYRQEKGEGKDE